MHGCDYLEGASNFVPWIGIADCENSSNNKLMVPFVDDATFCTNLEDLGCNAQSYMAY